MKILVTDRHAADTEEIEIAAAGDGIEVVFFDTPEAVTDDAWAAADGIVTYRGTAVVMAALPKLQRARVIVRGGVGFDGLDLEALGQRGIAVCTVPDYGTTEVADHALALMLALRRGLGLYHGTMRADPAGAWRYAENPCIDRLRGRVFGVVGLGRIGLAAARRAAGFDMEVAFYDPNLPDGVDLATGFKRMASLTDLAEMADSLSIHAPLNATTAKLIDQTVFQAMKPSAVLINPARGPIVDVDALYVALRDNHIAGADFLVLEGALGVRAGPPEGYGPGTWFYEPAGARHDATQRVSEDDLIYTANVYGPLFFDKGPGTPISAVVSWMDYVALAEAGGIKLVPNTFTNDSSLLAWAPIES